MQKNKNEFPVDNFYQSDDSVLYEIYFPDEEYGNESD